MVKRINRDKYGGFMGQGTESCGGYELHYDPVEEGLNSGEWQTRGGGAIRVSDMSAGHLKNAIRHSENKALSSSFSCDSEIWSEWENVLEIELAKRKTSRINTEPKPKKPTRGAKQKMKCHCGSEYEARVADLNRGWALSCSKSCSAIRRDFNKPSAIKLA